MAVTALSLLFCIAWAARCQIGLNEPRQTFQIHEAEQDFFHQEFVTYDMSRDKDFNQLWGEHSLKISRTPKGIVLQSTGADPFVYLNPEPIATKDRIIAMKVVLDVDRDTAFAVYAFYNKKHKMLREKVKQGRNELVFFLGFPEFSSPIKLRIDPVLTSGNCVIRSLRVYSAPIS